MRFIICITAFLLLVLSVNADNKEQHGYVRTADRANEKGKPLPGVIIRLKGNYNQYLSDESGLFEIPIPDAQEGKTEVSMARISKPGYQLIDDCMIGRKYAYSSSIPIEVVMVSKTLLEEIAENARAQTAKKYHEKVRLLEKQHDEMKISAEEYRNQILDLQEKYDRSETIIDKLAEYYAKTDYATLDDEGKKINYYIESGDVDRADSVLASIDMAHLHDEYNNLRRAEQITKDRADEIMAKLEKLYYQKYTTHTLKFENDSAAKYIELRAALDTTNIEWQLDAANVLYESLADYKGVQTYYERIMRQISTDTMRVDVAELYNLQGSIYQDQGLYNKSLIFYNKALKIYQDIYEGDDDAIATVYNNIGYTYSCLELNRKAEDYYELSIDMTKRMHGDSVSDLSINYINMGLIYAGMDRFDEAIKYYDMALTLCVDEVELSTIYNNIGLVYSSLDEYDKALEQYEKSLPVLIKRYGENCPLVAKSYINIGSVYNNLGNISKAEEYFQKSLQISEKIYGDSHPAMAMCYSKIGELHYQRKDYDEALKYVQKAMAIDIQFYGEKHTRVASDYNSLGYLYEDMHGDLDKALECYNKALSILVEVYNGEVHGDVALCYNNIGGVYFARGQYNKALENMTKALEISKKVYGEGHTRIALIYNSIGTINIYRGEFDIALHNLLQALSIYDEKNLSSSVDAATMFTNVGLAYFYKAETDKSQEYFERALKIYIEIYGESHPDVQQLRSIINGFNDPNATNQK